MKHSLPFGASLTEALVRKIAEMEHHCREQCPEFVPAIIWCRSNRGEHFGLFAIESRYLTADTLFIVEDVRVHVAPADQSRSTGRVLDWTDGLGVTDVPTSTI